MTRWLQPRWPFPQVFDNSLKLLLALSEITEQTSRVYSPQTLMIFIWHPIRPNYNPNSISPQLHLQLQSNSAQLHYCEHRNTDIFLWLTWALLASRFLKIVQAESSSRFSLLGCALRGISVDLLLFGLQTLIDELTGSSICLGLDPLPLQYDTTSFQHCHRQLLTALLWINHRHSPPLLRALQARLLGVTNRWYSHNLTLINSRFNFSQ